MNLVDVIAPVAQQRIVAGAPATLEVFFTDQDGESASATGTVTVHVQRANGTDVLAAGHAAADDTGSGGSAGRYTVALTAAQATPLDLLTAIWSVDGTPAKTTLVEVVGGVYFTVAEARTQIKTLTVEKYPLAAVLAARREVETEFERICRGAFVPRYRRIRMDSTGSTCMQMPDPLLRTVREVSPPAVATFDSDALAAITTSISGELARDDAFPMFSQGIVAYEHGLDRPPQAVKDMAFVRLREVLNVDNAGVDDRVTSYTVNGETYNLATAGDRSTGNPTIDAVLHGYDFRELCG